MESWTKQLYEMITMYLWNSCTSGCWRSSWSCKTPTRPALPGGSSSAPTWWCWKSAVNAPIAPAFPVGRCTSLAHNQTNVVHSTHTPLQFCHTSFCGYSVLWWKWGEKRRGKKKRWWIDTFLTTVCYKSHVPYMDMQMPLHSQGSGWAPHPLKTKTQKTERSRPKCCSSGKASSKRKPFMHRYTDIYTYPRKTTEAPYTVCMHLVQWTFNIHLGLVVACWSSLIIVVWCLL